MQKTRKTFDRLNPSHFLWSFFFCSMRLRLIEREKKTSKTKDNSERRNIGWIEGFLCVCLCATNQNVLSFLWIMKNQLRKYEWNESDHYRAKTFRILCVIRYLFMKSKIHVDCVTILLLLCIVKHRKLGFNFFHCGCFAKQPIAWIPFHSRKYKWMRMKTKFPLRSKHANIRALIRYIFHLFQEIILVHFLLSFSVVNLIFFVPFIFGMFLRVLAALIALQYIESLCKYF